MGRARVDSPQKLSKKLLKIRQLLGLSQNGLIASFGMTGSITQSEISAFENGKRVPALLVLLRYARAVDIHVDNLFDDEIDLLDR